MLPQGKPAQIGTGIQSIAAVGNRLVAVSTTGTVEEYDNGKWTSIGSNASQVAATDSGTFMIDKNDRSIWSYLGVLPQASQCQGLPIDGIPPLARFGPGNNCWARIGVNGQQIVASALGLFRIDSQDKNVYSYRAGTWTRIGVAVGLLAASDDELFVVNKDARTLWEWQGRPDYWQLIGDDVHRLVTAGTQVYIVRGTDANNTIWQYEGQPRLWTLIGEQVSSLAGNGDRLVGVNLSTQALWNYKGQHLWDPIPGGLTARSVAMGGDNLYVVESDNSLWTFR